MVDYGQDTTIILGKPWIVQHQCQLNFAKGCILFSLAHKKINLPMGNNTLCHALGPQTKIAIKPNEPLHPKPKTMSKTQPLPKLNQPQVHKVPRKHPNHKSTTRITQRWVPKPYCKHRDSIRERHLYGCQSKGKSRYTNPNNKHNKLFKRDRLNNTKLVLVP